MAEINAEGHPPTAVTVTIAITVTVAVPVTIPVAVTVTVTITVAVTVTITVIVTVTVTITLPFLAAMPQFIQPLPPPHTHEMASLSFQPGSPQARSYACVPGWQALWTLNLGFHPARGPHPTTTYACVPGWQALSGSVWCKT
eukprot:357270-Chlamydomonas_euryale.AAC.2